MKLGLNPLALFFVFSIGFLYNAIVLVNWYLPEGIANYAKSLPPLEGAWVLTKVALSDQYLPILLQGGLLSLFIFIFCYFLAFTIRVSLRKGGNKKWLG